MDILDKVCAIHAMAFFVVNAPNISPLQGQTCKRHKKDTVKKTGQGESVATNHHIETCLTNKYRHGNRLREEICTLLFIQSADKT